MNPKRLFGSDVSEIPGIGCVQNDELQLQLNAALHSLATNSASSSLRNQARLAANGEVSVLTLLQSEDLARQFSVKDEVAREIAIKEAVTDAR